MLKRKVKRPTCKPLDLQYRQLCVFPLKEEKVKKEGQILKSNLDRNLFKIKDLKCVSSDGDEAALIDKCKDGNGMWMI